MEPAIDTVTVGNTGKRAVEGEVVAGSMKEEVVDAHYGFLNTQALGVLLNGIGTRKVLRICVR